MEPKGVFLHVIDGSGQGRNKKKRNRGGGRGGVRVQTQKARACASANTKFNLVTLFCAMLQLARASKLLAQTMICVVMFFFPARTLALFFSDVTAFACDTLGHAVNLAAWLTANVMSGLVSFEMHNDILTTLAQFHCV